MQKIETNNCPNVCLLHSIYTTHIYKATIIIFELKKQMSLKKIIFFNTTSFEKIGEVQNDLTPYEITVYKLDLVMNDEIMTKILSQDIPREKIIGIMTEQTELKRKREGEFIHLEKVEHYSRLDFYSMCDGKINKDTFETTTSGFIDLSISQPEKRKYGWDDIFVIFSSMISYLEAQEQGEKISSRNINMSKLIEKKLHYKKRRDLTHNPQHFMETIDFSHDLQGYFKKIKEFNTSYIKNMGIYGLIANSYNQGLFMRSASTRRQSIYWCPGLNAGIPFVSKPKDPMHELTFQFHDISHFNIPDLIPDFSDKFMSIHRHVYIVYRLLSESMTLVLADMIFVNSLFESNIQYETVNQRKIYPIFREIIKNNHDEIKERHRLAKLIKKILYGSFRYCFYRDTSIWKEMMGSNSDEILGNFSNKYDNYFIEDFKWTNQNYNDMYKSKDIISKWWKNVENLREHGTNLELESVTEFIQRNNIDRFTDKHDMNNAIFEAVYETYIGRIFGSDNEFDNEFDVESNLTNAFIRYMIGQTRIFFSFEEIESSDKYFEKIKYAIVNGKITVEKIQVVRDFYEMFLNKLCDSRRITPDDVVTFKQIYPLFNPHYVDYDHNKNDKALDEYVSEILS